MKAGHFIAIVVVAGVTVLAQSRPTPVPAPIKNGTAVRAKYLSLLVGAGTTKVAPGERLTLFVQVTPNRNIHVYAPAQDGYLPVDLSIAPNPAFSVKSPVYPLAKPFTFAPTAETVKVYAEPFLIRQDIVIGSSSAMKRRAAAGETLTVVGSFQYQACDDSVCYRPETVAIKWTLRLIPVPRSPERSEGAERPARGEEPRAGAGVGPRAN